MGRETYNTSMLCRLRILYVVLSVVFYNMEKLGSVEKDIRMCKQDFGQETYDIIMSCSLSTCSTCSILCSILQHRHTG